MLVLSTLWKFAQIALNLVKKLDSTIKKQSRSLKNSLLSSCRTIFDDGELLEFAKLGSYLEYDLFGVEMLNYPYNLDVDMPSDSQRVKT